MENKKLLTIVVACYNEVQNVEPLVKEIFAVTDKKLTNYNVEIQFIDNKSTDGTRDILRKMCKEDKRVKAIFNAKNFGHIRSPFHGICEAKGDIVMLMCADFQDPPELIPEFVKKYEEGYDAVVGVKNKSKTNFFVNLVRKFYYFLIKKFADISQIKNFTGYGLYTRKIINIFRNLDNPYPYMRGLVSEFATNVYRLNYTQPQRKAGKTHNNFMTLYDMAMLGFTSYSKILVRAATFIAVFLGFASFVGLIIYFVFLGINWSGAHPSIVYPIICATGIIGAIILFFIGMVGEYVLRINTMVTKRPLVVEEERLNFYIDDENN